MVELIVSASDAGQRLNKYVMKYLNAAPSSFVYKMLRKKNIVLNDKKAKGDELLAHNDSVKLYLSDDTIAGFRTVKKYDNTGNLKANSNNAAKNVVNATSKNLKPKGDAVVKFGNNFTTRQLVVLYSNDNILAVHKPAGVLSQKASADDYSINECIIDYCRETGLVNDKVLETFTPSVCNRLDRNTSGIILAGITLRGSRYLSKKLKDRTMDKYYYTIVNGVMTSPHYCKGYINKNHDSNVSQVIDEGAYRKMVDAKERTAADYVPIETNFIPISSNKSYTLVKIKLITGKSHQIRAHLKHLGYPIIGDVKYGRKSANKYFKDKYGLNYQLLHAGICALDSDVTINDPLPELFVKICKGEGLAVDRI